MKIIITESQYSDLKFRRIYRKIQSEFDHKLDIYIPCNYNYEGGEYDFFNDVKSVTIESVVARLFDIYVDDESEEYDEEEFYENNYDDENEYYEDDEYEYDEKK